MKARVTRELHGQNAKDMISISGCFPKIIKDRKLTGELVLNFNSGGLCENFTWRMGDRKVIEIEVDWDALWK